MYEYIHLLIQQIFIGSVPRVLATAPSGRGQQINKQVDKMFQEVLNANKKTE